MDAAHILGFLELMGLPAKDRITGFDGTITSIDFNLYGCVHATVHPTVDKDGKEREGRWFDVSRLEITGDTRIMAVPDFKAQQYSTGGHASAAPKGNEVGKALPPD